MEPFAAQSSPVYRVIGISLGIHHFAVAGRDNNPASDRAVGADRRGLFGVLDLERLGFGSAGGQAYAQTACRQRRAGDLEETSSADIHTRLLSKYVDSKSFPVFSFPSTGGGDVSKPHPMSIIS